MSQTSYHVRRISTLALCLAAFVGMPSHAGLLDNLRLSGKDEQRVQEWEANPTQDLRWGDWERLRLASSATDAPNQHPVQLSPEQIAATLASIQVRPFKEVGPLFSDDELKKFALPISIALAKAAPGQDVEFVSVGQHGLLGIIAPQLANAGRIFYADGRLHVILGTVHKEFLGDYLRGSRRKPVFSFGSRAKTSVDVKIMGVDRGDGKVLRDDWISLAIVAGRSESGVKINTPPTATLSVTPAPTVVVPAADAADTLASKSGARLKALKSLKDQGLVSEEEYRQKRAEILKDL